MTFWFDKKEAKKRGKKGFIKKFSKIYPDMDLDKIFDDLVPPPKKTEETKEPKSHL